MKYDERNPFENKSKQAGGRGFYIALAVCLVAVCGVAVSSFIGGVSTDTKRGTTTAKVTTTAAQQVALPVTNITDERVTTTAVVTTTTTLAPTTTAAADLFVFPASNRVLLPYSEDMVYSDTLGEWRTHDGVDFLAEEGSQVKVPADGTVLRVYSDSLWGDVVEIDHGGKVTSRCCGVKAQNLKEGQSVKAGEVMGTVGEIAAEVAMEPHIHVEILANGKPVNPLLLMSGKTVNVTASAAATTNAK